jgi:hypothetical protein
MSVNFSKSPVWIVAVIVGLIAATALVAGYVDRPGTPAKVATADDKCASCPRAGTAECCQVTGTCAEGTHAAQTVAATCPATGAAVMAQTAETAGATCPAMAGASGTCSGMMAQTAAGTEGTCPVQAAAEGGCAGGQCPATK